MKNLFRVILLTGILVGAQSVTGAAQQRDIEEERSDPQGQAALRVEVDQIRVDVTVQDNNGNLITGLQKEHFEIYEENVKQEITFFEPIEAPMTAVLIVEYSNVLPWELLYEAIMASYTFVDQMRREDWIAVIAYDLKPEILVDFTQNKAEVYNALRRLTFPSFRESNLYDTVIDTLDRIQELDQKTAIVLLSTGLDTFSKKTLDDALRKVRQSNSVIYPVSLGGNLRARADHYMSTNTRMDLLQGDATLKYFARYTGGESYFPRFITEYPAIFQNISAMLRHQYSMGYVSSNTDKDDDKYRKIKVEVKADVDGDGKPDKLKVRHREGYLPGQGS